MSILTNQGETKMTRPITAGICAEVLAALPPLKVVKKVTKKIDRIINDKELSDDTIVFMTFTVGNLREVPDFWKSPFLVNNLVAAYIEKVTIDVANPLFAAIPGLTDEDKNDVVACTDQLQIDVTNEVLNICAQKYAKPEIVKVAVQFGHSPDSKYLF